MSEMIESQNQLFLGQMIPKPPLASVIYDAQDNGIFTCPHCKAFADMDACDVIGAEPGCVFCNVCNGEFEMP